MMSGLFGWLGASNAVDAEAALAAMARGLQKGEMYPAKTWVNGHAALFVAGGLPGCLYTTERQTSAAVVGNPRWIRHDRQELAETQGWARSICDAYQADGGDFLDDLRGPFALAIIDSRAGTMLLAIDCVGIQTLAYAETLQGCAFATDMDALRRHPDVTVTVGPQGVYRYVMNEVSPGPYTIYDGCHKLLPARRLVRNGSKTRIDRYWQIPYGQSATKSFPEFRDELFSLLDRAVRRSANLFPERGSVGAFLSGGLDSSAVCGFLQKMSNEPVPSFTVCFEDDQYDEGSYARIVAQHFGLDHHEYNLTSIEAAHIIPELAHIFDEPFGNSSAIAAYFCAKSAKDTGIRLLLAGDGGDEIFAGNKRYVEQKILQSYFRVPKLLRLILEAITVRTSEDALPNILAKAQRYIRRAKESVPERFHNASVYERQALADIFTTDALDEIEVEQPYDIWRKHYEDAGTDDLLYAMLYLDMQVTLADNDLRKVGRACDLADVAVAYPMLDEELIEYAASIPSSLLIKGFDLRYFFRRAMDGFLPEQIIKKKKHGFATPFRDWTRDSSEIRDLVRGAICDLKQRHIFHRDFLEDIIDSYNVDGPNRYDGITYDLVMLELWQQDRETS